MTEEMGPEGQRIQKILDELVRVTEGLLEAKVSNETIMEYLMETIAEMDEITKTRVIVFAVLEILKERIAE